MMILVIIISPGFAFFPPLLFKAYNFATVPISFLRWSIKLVQSFTVVRAECKKSLNTSCSLSEDGWQRRFPNALLVAYFLLCHKRSLFNLFSFCCSFDNFAFEEKRTKPIQMLSYIITFTQLETNSTNSTICVYYFDDPCLKKMYIKTQNQNYHQKTRSFSREYTFCSFLYHVEKQTELQRTISNCTEARKSDIVFFFRMIDAQFQIL